MGLFSGNNETVTTTFAGEDQLSPVVRGVRATMDRFKRDAATGFGLAAGISVFGLAKRAIGEVVDVLGDSVRAYMEDERSVAKLTTTLRNNAEGWDGNAEAINSVIDSRMRLAFTDDDLRDSLGKLVTRTKDVDEAFRLQTLAMDLARGRSISLASASDLIGKAYNGQIGALRRAGLAIDKNATSTEALAAVQRAYSGQAATYAETSAGKFEQFNIQVGELQDDLGSLLIGPATGFLGFLSDFVDEISGGNGASEAVNTFVKALYSVPDAADEAKEAVKQLATEYKVTFTEVSRMNIIQRQMTEQFGNTKNTLLTVAQAIGMTNADLDLFVSSGLTAGKTVQELGRDLVRFGVSQGAFSQSLLAKDLLDPQVWMEIHQEASRLVGVQERLNATAQRNNWGKAMERNRAIAGNALQELSDEAAETADEVAVSSRAIARELGPSLRSRIQSNRGEIDQVMKDLRFSLTHPMQLARQRTRILTLLMGEDIRKGMQSKRPEIRAEAMRVRMVFINMLRGLPGYARDQVAQMNAALASISMIPGFGGDIWDDLMDENTPNAPRRKKRRRRRRGSGGNGVGSLSMGASSFGGASGGDAPGEIVLQVDGEKLFRWFMRRQGREALRAMSG